MRSALNNVLTDPEISRDRKRMCYLSGNGPALETLGDHEINLISFTW